MITTKKRSVVIRALPFLSRKNLLEWAVQNQIRCVGFEADPRPPRRSFNSTSTWAVVG